MIQFDYVQIPTAGWADWLQNSKTTSPNGVFVQIQWGDHESLKGVRDLHSKSRLRIEKLFSLAHSLSIPLHLQFGFYDSKRSFPDWTKDLKPQALVPAYKGENGIEKWEYERLPSFRNQEVLEGFIGFIKEVASLAQLYQHPHGSIASTVFDFGLIRSDSYELSPHVISEYFTERFGSVDKLNSILQTAFRDFVSVASPRGLKTILMKRPWLASWEYKSLRNKTLKQWEDEIYHAFQSERIDCQIGKSKVAESKNDPPSVIVDDTFLEIAPNQKSCRPIVIQGELEPSALSAFRFAEMVKLEAETLNESVGWLSWSELESGISRYSFVGAKFLARKDVERFKYYINQGGQLFFPFGLPTWDENLNPIIWGESEGVKPVRDESNGSYQIRYGKGYVSYPIKALEIRPGFYSKLKGTA